MCWFSREFSELNTCSEALCSATQQPAAPSDLSESGINIIIQLLAGMLSISPNVKPSRFTEIFPLNLSGARTNQIIRLKVLRGGFATSTHRNILPSLHRDKIIIGYLQKVVFVADIHTKREPIPPFLIFKSGKSHFFVHSSASRMYNLDIEL